MSGRDVYGYEMARNRFSDHDVELLLSGGIPEEEGLARLAPLLQTMRRLHVRVPDEEAISRFATQAAETAAAAPAESATPPSHNRFTVLGSSRRFAAAAVGFALVMGMTGVAAASNGAAPGDPLYGIDRSLEALGIGDGGSAERIAEARHLLDGGHLSEAIAHAAEAVRSEEGEASQSDKSPASDALLDAADNVARSGSGEFRESVTAMLNEIAEMIDSEEFDGVDFGQRVAELARSLGRGNGIDNAPEPGPPTGNDSQGDGPPDDVPAGPPQGTPGEPPDSVPGNPPAGPPDSPPAGGGSPGRP